MTREYSKPGASCFDSFDEEMCLELLKNGNLEKGSSLKMTVSYLVTCIDLVEKTNIELYEQYRVLVDLFRQGIGTLTRQSWWQDEDYDQLEAETRQLLAEVILKACAMNVILQEKYQIIGEELMAVPGEEKN